MKQLTITVQSSSTEQRILIPKDLQNMRLTELMRRNAFSLNTRCGGRGLCDGCLVELRSGMLRHHLTGQHATTTAGHLIRACEYRLDGQDVTLVVPARSLLAYEPQVVSNFRANISRAHDPIWRCVELHANDLHNGLSSTVSKASESPVAISPDLLEQAKLMLAKGPAFGTLEQLADGWSVTRITQARPAEPLGVAVDIGTTTVALLVLELSTGKVVASASGFNRQMHLGDDVLTRINLCATEKSMLERLQWGVARDTIERLLIKALKDGNISDERIACFNVAANTTMLHLFAGVDPTPMGFAPFTAPFLAHKVLPSSVVSLKLSSRNAGDGETAAPDPNVHLLPSASAYVGADITAGVVSSGLVYDDGPSLLVDVGTNGEIVLKHRNHMWGTATAAGPAFEGSRMACGMRAGQGAVSHIHMERTPAGLDVTAETIGNVKPTGICGSAYVDFLAQARKVGVLSESGRFESGIADDRIGPYRTFGRAFRVAYGHGHEPIVIGEADVASLLQAKAAIAAGILTLLRRIGMKPEEIRTLYLAGGFGMHLDVPNTIRSGLLPGFKPAQVQLVGNTSLAGAYLSLLDVGVLKEIRRVAKEIEIVELNLDPEFESCYIDQLSLA